MDDATIRVDGATRTGDRIGPLWLTATEAEAADYDRAPFDDASNIAWTTTTRETAQ